MLFYASAVGSLGQGDLALVSETFTGRTEPEHSRSNRGFARPGRHRGTLCVC